MTNRWVLLLIGICLFFSISSYSWYGEFNKYVRLVDQSPKAVPISVEVVKTGKIAQWVMAEGITSAKKLRCLNFEIPGRVSSLGITPSGAEIYEGAIVFGPSKAETYGQLLAQLDDRHYYQKLLEAKADYQRSLKLLELANTHFKQAENTFRFRKKTFLRNDKLVKKRLITESIHEQSLLEFETAQSTLNSANIRIEEAKVSADAAKARFEFSKLEYDKTKLYAPWNGTVARLNIKPGQFVGATPNSSSNDDETFKNCAITIIDPQQFEIKLQIPFYEGVAIKKGNLVLIQSVQHPIDPNQNSVGYVSGVVYSISPVLTSQIHAFQVIVRTSKPTSRLRVRELVSVRIKTIEHSNRLLLPQRALLYQNNRPYLFVVNNTHTTVEKRFVELGIRERNTFEVIQGVTPEELIVTDGRLLLTHGSQIEIVALNK